MLTIKVTAIFLVFQAASAFPITKQPHEISYIDSEVMGVLQEILEHKFDEINKKIDVLSKTTTMQTTTEPTTEPEEESTNLSPKEDLEFHWFVVVLTTIFTILGIFLIVMMTIFFCIWIKKWTNEGYFKRNPEVNHCTRIRPVNRESWFYLG